MTITIYTKFLGMSGTMEVENFNDFLKKMSDIQLNQNSDMKITCGSFEAQITLDKMRAIKNNKNANS